MVKLLQLNECNGWNQGFMWLPKDHLQILFILVESVRSDGRSDGWVQKIFGFALIRVERSSTKEAVPF